MEASTFESLRKRMRVPLERICFFGLLHVLSFSKALSGGKQVPFEVCGIVYATPPRELYISVMVVSTFSFLNSLDPVLNRCVLFWTRPTEEFRRAHLVPCIGLDIHNNRTAVYMRRWSVVPSLASYLIIPIFITCITRHLTPYLALGFIIVLQVLNIVLAIVRICTSPDKQTLLTKCIDMISILATDKEYEAPNFEINEVSPVDLEAIESSSHFAEISSHSDVAIDFGNQTSLFIRNDRRVGLQTPFPWPRWKGLSGMRPPPGRLVEIQDEHLNFELLPLRVPYSIMWYFTYEGMNAMGAFKGADEIDKCLLWLVIVSTMTAILVSWIPGPCVVIKKIVLQ